jgi:alpha-beta hydrolase superfamily lysophospholipase
LLRPNEARDVTLLAPPHGINRMGSLGAHASLLPGYFDGQCGRLYGCLHLPGDPQPDSGCIVLCNSVGQEGVRCQRSFRNIGEALRRRGHFVYSFDYYGCGDSEGDCEQGRMDTWRMDVLAASEQALGLSGVRPIALVGCRLGATIMMAAATATASLCCAAAWDPVLSGNQYLQDIRREDARTRATGLIGRRYPPWALREASGFAVSRSLARDLKLLRELPTSGLPANRVLLLTTSNRARDRTRLETLAQRRGWEFRGCSPCPAWRRLDNKAVVPTEGVRQLAEWVDGVLRG